MGQIPQFLKGTTFKTTWVSSGVSAGPILSLFYTGSETLVDSVSMTDSGNGHYFAYHTVPLTLGYYVNELRATINARVYIARQYFESVAKEAD